MKKFKSTRYISAENILLLTSLFSINIFKYKRKKNYSTESTKKLFSNLFKMKEIFILLGVTILF